MPETSESVRVHVNIEISAAALKAVVKNAKQKAGQDENGRYRVDPADVLADLISRFLEEKGFDAFAADMDNY